MKLNQLDLNLLLVLEAVLISGSITQASKELGQTASATSHALRRLREAFGDELLVRQGNRMLRTPRAEALVEPLRQHLQGLRSIVEEESTFEPLHSSRRFVLASEDLFASVVLPQFMKLLSKTAPHVDVDVVSSTGINLNVLAEDVDLFLGPISRGRDWTLRQPLFDDDYICIVSNELALPDDELTLETYAKLPHILVGVGERGPTYVDDELKKQKLERRIVLRVPSFSSAQQVVATAPYLATLPSFAVQNVPTSVRTFPVPLILPQLHYAQLWHARWQRDIGHIWLRNQIKNIAQGLKASALRS